MCLHFVNVYEGYAPLEVCMAWISRGGACVWIHSPLGDLWTQSWQYIHMHVNSHNTPQCLHPKLQ